MARAYTKIFPYSLQGIILGKVKQEVVIHSDGWRGDDELVDMGYDKHYRVHHSHNEFACSDNHINGIQSF